MSKQLYIKTFGCQMNEHDSEKIAGVLSDLGYSLSESPEGADMIILNTCSVREKAESKCFSDLGRLNELKKNNPDLMIGVGGCVAQQEGDHIVRKAPYVDLVFGTSNIADIPRLLEKKREKSRGVVDTARKKKSSSPMNEVSSFPILRQHPVKAYVNIVDGCDKFCTYCVVPHTRGRERSRPPEDICNEIAGLASAGYKEVTLLGQNVDAYGNDIRDNIDLAGLLQMINEISGIQRIRFVTSHPADFSDKLIHAMGVLSNVCEHLHLPLQSGSDAVLARMKRNYTCSDYKEKIRKLRDTIPDVSITTDIIAGFPGETEDDFRMTLEALEEIRFDAIYAFKYSKRPFTAAHLYENQVPHGVGKERLNMVLETQKQITIEKNRSCINKEEDILIEGVSKKDKGNLTGRTRGSKIVHIPKEEGIRLGDIIKVRITSATLASLKGEPVRSVYQP